MMFRVGQKIVCVSLPSNGTGYGDEILPSVGGIYTIRGIETNRPHGHPVGFLLEEIVNGPRHYLGYFDATETTFAAFRFRPVVERKTDISIFQKMLTPSDEEIGTDTLEPFPTGVSA